MKPLTVTRTTTLVPVMLVALPARKVTAGPDLEIEADLAWPAAPNAPEALTSPSLSATKSWPETLALTAGYVRLVGAFHGASGFGKV